MLIFAMFSSVRVVSYLPQIYRVASDPNGASAISYATWSLWLGANLATALYAAVNLQDMWLAIVSVLYATCCLSVIALTSIKRRNKSGAAISQNLLATARGTAIRRAELMDRLSRDGFARANGVFSRTGYHGASDRELRQLCNEIFLCDVRTVVLLGAAQVLLGLRKPKRPNPFGARANASS